LEGDVPPVDPRTTAHRQPDRFRAIPSVEWREATLGGKIATAAVLAVLGIYATLILMPSLLPI
jgi:hypothetical protein